MRRQERPAPSPRLTRRAAGFKRRKPRRPARTGWCYDRRQRSGVEGMFAARSPRRTFLNWSVDSSSERALAPGPPCAAWSRAPKDRAFRRLRGAAGARRLAHVLARVVEALAVFALVGALALAVRLSQGPIYLEALHDKIASSLQERAGDGYAVDLGPTYVMHDSWGVGLGFRRLTVRDAAGRTVLSAPTGKIALDPFAAFLAQVKVRRLELDGLSMRLRVAAGRRAVDRRLGRRQRGADRPAELRFGAREPQPRRADPRRRRGDGRRGPGGRPADPRQRPLQDRQRCDASLGDVQ